MSTIKLMHIHRFVDRHGKERIYFRYPGLKSIKLPGKPGSPEFIAAYKDAVDGVPSVQQSRKSVTKGGDRSLAALAKIYYATDFKHIPTASSQLTVKRILDKFIREHGHRSAVELTKMDAKLIIGDRSETPAGANNLLRRARILMNTAIDADWRSDNPFEKIPLFEIGTHHTWNEIEIDQFQNRYPLGTRERTAFALLLYTGQRVSDVAKMRLAEYNEAAGQITVQQTKGADARKDRTLMIACHPDLVEALAAWKAACARPGTVAPISGVFISTPSGEEYASKSLGEWMATLFDEAGLPDRCVSHGLRKAAARRLAEAGCSAHEIMSMTGHKSIDEVQRYCIAANQAKLAKQAVARMREQFRDVG